MTKMGKTVDTAPSVPIYSSTSTFGEGLRFTGILVLSLGVMMGVVTWLHQQTGLDSEQAFRRAEQSVLEYCRVESGKTCDIQLIDATAPSDRLLASAPSASKMTSPASSSRVLQATPWQFRFRNTQGRLFTVQVNEQGGDRIQTSSAHKP